MADEPRDTSYTLVRLDADDDIATICGKVDTAHHQRVLLVAPNGNAALAGRLGMAILHRHAETGGRDIVFVSRKGSIRKRARGEGIRAFRSLRWMRFEVKEPSRLRLALGAKIIALPAYRALLRLGLGLVTVAAGLAAAYLLVPSATVVIYPEGRLTSQTLPLTASTVVAEVDPVSMTVPAFFAEVPLEMDLALVTTGKVMVGDNAASGSVVFTNQTEQALVIPKGTEVVTASGVAFRTTQEAALAAVKGERAEVPIQAVIRGSRGNVGPTEITGVRGPPRTKVLVTNRVAAGGGSDREAQGVSLEDIDRLRALVEELMRKRGLEQVVRGQKEEGVTIYPTTASLQLTETRFSHKVGEPTPWLIATARGRLRVLAIRQQDIQELAVRSLALTNPDRNAAVLEGSFRVLEATVDQLGDQTAKLAVVTEMEVADGLDRRRIRNDLRGRSVSGARDYLTQQLRMRQPPQVEVTPGWGFGIPFFDWRIDLRVEASSKASEKVEKGLEEGLQSQKGP